jgi:3-hydroxyacyl-[acyl-carrier-protein] dehydratase
MQLEYFKLIDRIVDLNVGEKTIVVEAQVPQHSTIFEGHFPGYPIMPGVLLIESTIHANLVHDGSGYSITEAKIRVDGKLRSNATLTFSHIPFPSPDLRVHMDAEAQRIGFPQQATTHD